MPALPSKQRRFGNNTAPLYAKKKKAEKQAGGNGWDTIRWKQDLLERTCITMAVANFRLLDAHTRAP